MNQEIVCKTSAEAMAAIESGDVPILEGDFSISVSVDCKIICNKGQPHVEAWGSSQPRVVARESSQPRVEAWESSQPHVVARESSQPRVVARESSQPRVVARESSQPHVEAWGSSQPHVAAKANCQVHVRGNVSVVAAAAVAILISGGSPTITGGGYISRVNIESPASWCDYYGADVVDGYALLFKALDSDFKANYNQFDYTPGTTPEAPDWDGGERECGGGLHFSPTPLHALEFFSGAKRFVCCRVALDSIVVHPNGDYPQKVKAPRVAEIWEVDRYGKRIES
jgi:hypothetical protein